MHVRLGFKTRQIHGTSREYLCRRRGMSHGSHRSHGTYGGHGTRGTRGTHGFHGTYGTYGSHNRAPLKLIKSVG